MDTKTVHLTPELHSKLNQRKKAHKTKTKKTLEQLTNNFVQLGIMRVEIVESKYKKLNLLHIERDLYYIEDSKKGSFPVVKIKDNRALCIDDEKDSCDHAKFIAEIVGL